MKPLPPARPHGPRHLLPARLRASLGAAVGLGLLFPSTLSAAEAARRTFDIPAGDAATTLKQFATQSSTQLLYSPDEVRGIQTRAVQGEFSSFAALSHMLERTPLKARQDEGTKAIAVTVRPPSHAPPSSEAQQRPPSTPQTSPPQTSDSPPMKKRSIISFFASLLTLGLSGSHSDAAESRPVGSALELTGTLRGSVSSAQTRNMLQGAVVDIPGINRQIVTDDAGRFVATGLPLGPLDLIVSYSGFDDLRRSVVVGKEPAPILALELSQSEVLTMSPFTVASEREGNALAIVSQRYADNLKNTVAMDAFGNLPNMSPGELLLRLPGVTGGNIDEEGNVTAASVRGMPFDMSRVSVDGNAMAAVGRSVGMHSITGAIFEQIELIKGQTPDKSADSIGGGINLKTRSPLSMSEKRRISYSVGGRWVPSFFPQSEARLSHNGHPLISLSAQEAFDVGGGARNLGIAFSVFYSENANTAETENYSHQNTTTSPAYIYNFTSTTRYNNRRITSANLKAEYRHSTRSKFILSLMYNRGDEAANVGLTPSVFSSQAIAAVNAAGQLTGTNAILPNFTDTRTETRGTSPSNFQISTIHSSYLSQTPAVSLHGEHALGRWDLAYNGYFSRIHADVGSGRKGDGGNLVARVASVGWALDKSDPGKPVLQQTEGPDIYDIRNYKTAVSQTKRDTISDSDSMNFKADVSYRADARHPFNLKSGLMIRRQTSNAANQNSRQWSRVASAPPLPSVRPGIVSTFEERSGRLLPAVDARVTNLEVVDPALWLEDLYYGAQQFYTGFSKATEDVLAFYGMAQAKIGRLGALGGVRFENTEVTGTGYTLTRPATATQMPNPVERARYQYGLVRRTGSYDRSFPSAHFTYDLGANLKARASWSTSFGRPAFTSLLPRANVNSGAQTVTVGNPALGPQYAKNTDLSLEYYFRTGLVSAGYFKKNIKDYIVTSEIGIVAGGTDNGFDGNYSGYRLLSSRNAGTANVEGWEFDYRQQLTFLPGALKGFALAGNFTYLMAEGDFGGSEIRKSKEVEGFIPKAGNVSLSYNYRRFGTRILLNHSDEYLLSDNASAALFVYVKARTTVNWGLTYRIAAAATLFCDVTNIFGEPMVRYQYLPVRVSRYNRVNPPQALTVGVSGQY